MTDESLLPHNYIEVLSRENFYLHEEASQVNDAIKTLMKRVSNETKVALADLLTEVDRLTELEIAANRKKMEDQ